MGFKKGVLLMAARDKYAEDADVKERLSEDDSEEKSSG